MSTKASITWSNSHQRYLDEILSEALRNGYLEITNTSEFSLSAEFFQQNTSKEFLAHIPRELLEMMVAAWIKKQLCKGAEGDPVRRE